MYRHIIFASFPRVAAFVLFELLLLHLTDAAILLPMCLAGMAKVALPWREMMIVIALMDLSRVTPSVPQY